MSLVFDYSSINKHLNKRSKTNRDTLAEARDILLPGLWCVGSSLGSDYEFDIRVDFKAECLLIVGLKKSTKQELAFCLFIDSIIDGSYKRVFKPALDNMEALLKTDTVIP
jgi:hypothetical protein